MKKRYADKTNVLLVNITRLGDMLQATPTIAGIKAENKDCKVTVLVEKQFEAVCHILPHIDEIVSLDLSMTVRALAREQDGIVDAYEYLSEMIEDLRAKQFDYCLNMSSSAYTALLIHLVGITRSGGWTADDEGYRAIESDWAKLFASSVFHQNRQFNSLNLVDVFRCSADVEEHPKKLLINVDQQAEAYCETMLREAGFTNSGPLIAVQAGASQAKRQWAPRNFVSLINILLDKVKARVVLTGSKKELPIMQEIAASCKSPNVFIAGGRTNIPQLAALLKASKLLITGDTGPMHISVAVGTPVVSMFLASAYGFETGPYSEGNLVVQPVIACGPCNPNKACARPDCHDTISAELMAELVCLRLQSDFRTLPQGLVDPTKAIVYRSYFDRYNFCDLEALSPPFGDGFRRYRDAYRYTWLDDLGGYSFNDILSRPLQAAGGLKVISEEVAGLDQLLRYAEEGERLIDELVRLIKDSSAPAKQLGVVNQALSELDRAIESLGFEQAALGPVARMFVFAKENLSGTEALSLASQMQGNYTDLKRRVRKFSEYFQCIK